MELDPIAVGLKFGFLAVLYLFLLWVARSALKDLRRGTEDGLRGSECGLRGRHRACTRASAPLGRDGRRAEAAREGRSGPGGRAPPMI